MTEFLVWKLCVKESSLRLLSKIDAVLFVEIVGKNSQNSGQKMNIQLELYRNVRLPGAPMSRMRS